MTNMKELRKKLRFDFDGGKVTLINFLLIGFTAFFSVVIALFLFINL